MLSQDEELIPARLADIYRFSENRATTFKTQKYAYNKRLDYFYCVSLQF